MQIFPQRNNRTDSQNPATLFDRIQTAVAHIRSLGYIDTPTTAMIFGSGLGAMSDVMQIEAEIPYEHIPGFVSTTLDFHKGRLLLGKVAGQPIVAMDGRFHYYEGYSMMEVTFPVRVMRALGAGRLIISNISGGLNPQYRAGDIVLIADQINLMGDNPLIGHNDDRLGQRFPDMMEPYSNRLIQLAEKHAMMNGIRLPRGVYLALSGPLFETRAEYRMIRQLGADMVGMSSVPEVIAAVHGGMEILGFSLISDECFPDSLVPIDLPVLLQRAKDGSEIIGRIITNLLQDPDYNNLQIIVPGVSP